MRVLAIGAHPDDIESFAGGTMALYAAQGHSVTFAIATRGDIGSPRGTRDEIANIRRNEAQAACDLIGAELIWMGFDDEFLFSDRETRLTFIDAIRRARPDVMFILSECDYHPDHRIAGTIARDARIPASVPLIETRYPETGIPTVFLMDTYDGTGFEPEAYVDISSTVTTKTQMLAAHRSQAEWIESVFDTELDDDTTLRAQRRGAESGVALAEGFRLLTDYPRTGGFELLPDGFVTLRPPTAPSI